MDEYQPTRPELQRVKSRVSPQTWRKRIAKARADEVVLKKILGAVERCGSLNEAMAELLPSSRRSWALRRIASYRLHGFEGLIDERTPREPKISKECRQALQAARAANPKVTVVQALEILQNLGHKTLPSESTIKREFRRVDDRQRYAARKKQAAQDVVELPFAGGELLLAAETETGGLSALTETVMELGEEARLEADGRTPGKDVGYRDRRGRFTITYNRRRRRKRGEAVPDYLKSAEEKAEGRVPTWPQFVHERDVTIEAKIRMLTFGWMVATTKGWAALRAPDTAGLETLTGFAYMPSTLAKFVSALAISGAGTPLLETVGQHWHEVAQAHFDEPGAMAALYIDNHAKEVWSSLYTQSGKVSHLNRVMPCITTTYAHTGAGTPLVLSVQSGSAPLAPRLVNLVEKVEESLGGEIARAVVIDSEGSTFDLLNSFAEREQVLITPLRPARAANLILSYSPGSYFRPYRENDELRIARCTLTQKETGRSLELGALLVRREHRESDTVLLTNGLDLGLEGRELADLYFRRWPIQENAFKEAAVVGLDQHRGNCGRMVANVTVVTKLEKIAARLKRINETLASLYADSDAVKATAVKSAKEERRALSFLATRRRRVDALIASGKTAGRTFARAAVEHQQALGRAEKMTTAATNARKSADQHEERVEKLEKQAEELAARQKHLEPQRTIRQLDVAQDSILTATKLTAIQLITFALRKYLPALSMTPETFVSRVFPVRGRREIDPDLERVVFYENPRDPEVTAALRDACCRLNKRDLRRDDRRLRYAVESARESSQSG